MKAGDGPGPVVYGTVALISAITLAYEILLLRVFSFSQWHHFASLAVALALLGFGASGTALTLLGERVNRWGDRLFLGGLLLGALGMVMAFWTGQWIAVRPLFAVWDYRELGKLLLVDFASFVPFFGFALAIGHVFIRWPEATSRLYAANLLGAGAGSLAAGLLLSTLYLETALMCLPLAALATGWAYSWARHPGRIISWALGIMAALIGIWILYGLPQLPLSDFKRLAYLLDPPNAKVLERQPGLRSEVRIVQSEYARIASGLSIQWMNTIPNQDVLVLGTDHTLPLPRAGTSTGYRQATLAYLPFLLKLSGQVAWLDASHWLPPDNGRPIKWIVENPQVLKLMRSRVATEGWKYEKGESRLFLDTTDQHFSIIFFSRAANEGDAATEDYLLTVEGIKAGLSRLDEGGILAIPLNLSYPPRYGPKLLATAAEALRESSSPIPWQRAAMLRSLHAGLLLLSNLPFPSEDIEKIRGFAEQWGFDLVALPGLVQSETNRVHQWPSPLLYHSARVALAGDDYTPSESSWYTSRAPRDVRPYFWQSMKWSQLPDLWRAQGSSGLIWLDWTLLVTAIKLVVAAVLAALLILLPLGKLRAIPGRGVRCRVWLYFSALGLGYMLVEMAAFQRSMRYLEHPVTTASLVFAVFLVGSGCGSLKTPKAASRNCLLRIFGPIIGFSVLALIILGPGEKAILALPDYGRATSVGLALLPVAWAMGRAFPWGLRQLDSVRPLIPWAWGINGFASVIAAPLAVLLAVHGNQFGTWLAGALCYVVASWVGLGWTRQTRRQ